MIKSLWHSIVDSIAPVGERIMRSVCLSVSLAVEMASDVMYAIAASAKAIADDAIALADDLHEVGLPADRLPVGVSEYESFEDKSILIQKLMIGPDGFDRNGMYWGMDTQYVAFTRDRLFKRYVVARDRHEAIERLGLGNHLDKIAKR